MQQYNNYLFILIKLALYKYQELSNFTRFELKFFLTLSREKAMEAKQIRKNILHRNLVYYMLEKYN